MGDKIKELLKKPVFWIVIAAVALFAIIRSRATAGRPTPESGQQPLQGGGGGGGFSNQGTSTADQMAQQDIAASQQQLKQQEALFNFDLLQKQKYADLLAPFQKAWADTQEALQKGVLSQVKHTKAQCAHGDAKIDPQTGQLYCRTPEGGGFKPFQQIGNIFSGALKGLGDIAPDLTKVYVGRQFKAFGAFSGYGQSGDEETGGGQSQRVGQRGNRSARTEQGVNPNPSGMTGSPFKISGFPSSFPGLS